NIRAHIRLWLHDPRSLLLKNGYDRIEKWKCLLLSCKEESDGMRCAKISLDRGKMLRHTVLLIFGVGGRAFPPVLFVHPCHKANRTFRSQTKLFQDERSFHRHRNTRTVV